MLIIPDRLRLQESLALAREYALGFEYNDFFTNLDDGGAMEETILLYRRNLPPGGCTMHGAFFDLAVGSADARIRAASQNRVRQSMQIARKLGARAIVFHTNSIPSLRSRSYRDGWVESNAAFYSEILAENRDLSVYIENMFDEEPELLVRLSERLSDQANYGVCLDFAHASLFGTQIERWVDALAPYLKHIHLNDCDGLEDSHLALGRGVLDIPAFFALLKKYRFAGSMLLEVSGLEAQMECLTYLREHDLRTDEWQAAGSTEEA
ncbi:MAG: sugar phosphate isomerase/epimerase family protein [Christensenella sp.]|nr:sugar phosphate isomerase/epimerase family protein [Christensenella sp.]